MRLRTLALLALALTPVMAGALPAQPPAFADTIQPIEAVTLPPELARQAQQMEQLLGIYARMPGLRDVQLHLDRGILVVSGSVLTAEEKEQALELARRVFPEVIHVDYRGLQVETDLRKRLDPAMERIREKSVAFLRFLPAFLLGIVIVGVGALVAWWVGAREWLFGTAARNPFARNLLRQTVRAVIVLVALLLALDLMGVTTLVGALLGAAGVVGIAVGFAFRDIVENYLAGILLSLRQPFAPNDHVQLAGEEGRVIRLTGRETVLMTLDGNHVRIPNATVFKAVITNLTRNPRRRFHFLVGVAPWEHLGRAIAVAKEAVGSVSGVLEMPAPSIRVHELQDSAVALRVSGWVNQSETDFGKARSQAIRAVKEAFEAAGVATPPPEFGVRLLAGEAEGGGVAGVPSSGGADRRGVPPATGTTPPASGATQPSTAAAPSPAGPLPEEDEADMSPDTTIEEEIARELRESREENYLG